MGKEKFSFATRLYGKLKNWGGYDRISSGSVAEWLKAHDSKSCGRVDRLGGSNPLASATFLSECFKKRNSYLALLDANPLASATFLSECFKKRNSYLVLLDANPLASATPLARCLKKRNSYLVLLRMGSFLLVAYSMCG